MAREPTLSPVARVNDPLKASLPTSGPPLVMEYVRAGSGSPYVFVFASAVTVTALAVIAKSAGTNVIAYLLLASVPAESA